jgi:Ca2+-binding EF-hand superfamily protein
MPPKGQKRGAATQVVGAKKLKTEAALKVEPDLAKPTFVRKNEVLEHVKLVLRAFTDEEQVGLLSISSEARDLLHSIVQSALGHGSASDERHDYQTRMANAIGSALAESMKVGADKLSEAKEGLKTADIGLTDAQSAVAAAKTNLETCVQNVKNKKEQYDKSLPAVTEEQQKVTAGEKEVEKFAGTLQKKREDRDKFQKTIESHYEILKAYEWESPAAQKKGEKKLLTALESTMKKLKADASMFLAVRNALVKSPADRSQFELSAMESVEAKFNQHLQGLEEQLSIAEKANAEKVGVCAEAAAALEAAQTSRTDLKQVREALERAEVKLAESQSLMDARERLSTRTKETIDAFTFLYERRINPEAPLCTFAFNVEVQKDCEPVQESSLKAEVENKKEEKKEELVKEETTKEEDQPMSPSPKTEEASNAALSPAAFGNLRGFHAQGRFKKAALTAMAKHLGDSALIQDLKEMFYALDPDGNGTITLDELRDGIQKMGVEVPEDLMKIMAEVDSDGSGEIDYSEFLAATLDRRHFMCEDVCWAAFRTFDLDGNGQITKEELLEVLTGNASENIEEVLGMHRDEIEQIIRDADVDGDGEIDFEEFVLMMSGGKESRTPSMKSMKGKSVASSKFASSDGSRTPDYAVGETRRARFSDPEVTSMISGSGKELVPEPPILE